MERLINTTRAALSERVTNDCACLVQEYLAYVRAVHIPPHCLVSSLNQMESPSPLINRSPHQCLWRFWWNRDGALGPVSPSFPFLPVALLSCEDRLVNRGDYSVLVYDCVVVAVQPSLWCPSPGAPWRLGADKCTIDRDHPDPTTLLNHGSSCYRGKGCCCGLEDRRNRRIRLLEPIARIPPPNGVYETRLLLYSWCEPNEFVDLPDTRSWHGSDKYGWYSGMRYPLQTEAQL